MIDRRQILIALAALVAAPAATAAPAVDPEGAKRIGQAYKAAHPGFDARKAAELAPGDWDPAALTKLRARAASDFKAGRVFVYRGWRLSDTEGRLFALLA